MAFNTTLALSATGVATVAEEDMIGDTNRVIIDVNPDDAGETLTITHGVDRTGTRDIRLYNAAGVEKTFTTASVTSITRTSTTVTTIVFPASVAAHRLIMEWKR